MLHSNSLLIDFVNSLDLHVQYCLCCLFQGDKGPIGNPGMPGVQGIQGDMGRPGEKGSQGEVGPEVSGLFVSSFVSSPPVRSVL